MLRFFLGLLVGLLAGAAGTWLLLHRPAPAPPMEPTAPITTRPTREPPRKSRRAAPAAHPTDEAPIELTAADRVTATEGEALRAAATTLDMSSGSEPRSLTQEEIDGALGRRAAAIIRCITDARGAAELGGRVVAGMVVAADGRVRSTRVEAPAYLLHHGLGGCVRGELAAVRFPATGKENVVTVPFDIQE